MPIEPAPPAREGGAAARPAPFAYVLMAHTDPARVLAAVRRTRSLSPSAGVLVRHTRGPGFLREEDLAALGAAQLHSRVRVRWGTWSLVAAVLEALGEAERRWQPAATVVVSGQDHPVLDLSAWEERLRAAGTDALLRPDPREYPERYASCWHPVPGTGAAPPCWCRAAARASDVLAGRAGRGPLQFAGERTLLLRHARTGGAPPVPPGLRYRKGSLWATLSARAVERVLAAARDEPLRRFFASTLLPDESFVHTVLRAQADLRVVDGPTTLPFFPPGGASHPRSVVLADLDAVRRSGAAFTRKVVSPDSDAFVRAVDALVDRERSAPAR
ncbi:hypothetical protein [Kineococcus gypseus]|uniref:hypothetical protein n=1 Tax=Kineococcus gypseus TaxID=1637102 RepID=UPI003D7ECCB4